MTVSVICSVISSWGTIIKGLMNDGYKLASKCGLWTDIYKKITEIKILMIALVVQPSIRCPAEDRDVTLVTLL